MIRFNIYITLLLLIAIVSCQKEILIDDSISEQNYNASEQTDEVLKRLRSECLSFLDDNNLPVPKNKEELKQVSNLLFQSSVDREKLSLSQQEYDQMFDDFFTKTNFFVQSLKDEEKTEFEQKLACEILKTQLSEKNYDFLNYGFLSFWLGYIISDVNSNYINAEDPCLRFYINTFIGLVSIAYALLVYISINLISR